MHAIGESNNILKSFGLDYILLLPRRNWQRTSSADYLIVLLCSRACVCVCVSPFVDCRACVMCMSVTTTSNVISAVERLTRPIPARRTHTPHIQALAIAFDWNCMLIVDAAMCVFVCVGKHRVHCEMDYLWILICLNMHVSGIITSTQLSWWLQR